MVMQTSPVEMRICLEVWDACDLSQTLHALGRLQRIPRSLERRAQRLDSIERQLSLNGIVVHMPSRRPP